jgi:hypothetical protein
MSSQRFSDKVHKKNIAEQSFFAPFISGLFSRRVFDPDFAVDTCWCFQIIATTRAS